MLNTFDEIQLILQSDNSTQTHASLLQLLEKQHMFVWPREVIDLTGLLRSLHMHNNADLTADDLIGAVHALSSHSAFTALVKFLGSEDMLIPRAQEDLLFALPKKSNSRPRVWDRLETKSVASAKPQARASAIIASSAGSEGAVFSCCRADFRLLIL